MARQPHFAHRHRTLFIETLERRELLSAAPFSRTTAVDVAAAPLMPAIMTAVQSAAPKTQAQAADRIFKVNVQLGGGILSQITNVVSELDGMEKSIVSVLSEIPGWHLTADVDRTPQLSGSVTGTIDEASNGKLKSASLSVTVSADASATIEGYYGVSVLHVGLSASAELCESLNVSASFSTSGGWAFGGSVTASGSLKGDAMATAILWKGEVYAQGTITSTMSINHSGKVAGNLVLSAVVGADIQQYSVTKKQWNTYWDRSISLGNKSYAYSFDAVTIFQKGVDIAIPGGGIIV